MHCPNCNEIVPDAQRYCLACGKDAGFPNVRLAQRQQEVTELDARVNMASASATAAGYDTVMDDFGQSVSNSRAIIAKPLRLLQDLIETEHRTYSSYHKQLSAGTRVASNDIFDRTRAQFENALFPNFYQDMCFAALTLDDSWVHWFGEYAMILKEPMIAHRTTVFEENPFHFVRRLKLSLTATMPPGYRAVWDRRHDIAKAKLYSKLTSHTTQQDYPAILMNNANGSEEADYIEVHIYGPFTRAAIDNIVGPKPRSHEDRIIWRKFKMDAKKIGITVKET